MKTGELVFAPSNRIRNSAIGNSLVLVHPIAQRELIVAANDAAKARGIRPGMTLAEARALDAKVLHAPHEPHQDAVALEALARWMMRFSPIVTLSQREREHEEHGLFLDLTGCDRVFGGFENIVRHVRSALNRLHITAHLAVAPNPAAGWALTFSPAHQGVIVTDKELPEVLLSLPPAVLRIDPQTIASLHHVGLNTIRQIVNLPRESLPARFGPLLLQRLGQAFGTISEPLVPIEPFSPISARMDFDGAVDSLEAIWLVFKKLIEQIVTELLKRGRGARSIEVEFYRAYAVTLRQTIRLSRASRDPVNIFNLLRCAMENVETDVGFLGIQLIVTSSQRVADEQITLLEHEEFSGQIELGHLIERLCVRMGQEAVAQAEPVESHVPENAFVWYGRLAHAPDTWARRPCHQTLRPLHLFDHPEEIHVIVTPSEDRDGKPIQFTRPECGGAVHRLSHATGPERIAGQWWRGHNKTRDYFDVEDESTRQRFWIFRVQETSRWFVHGEFE